MALFFVHFSCFSCFLGGKNTSITLETKKAVFSGLVVTTFPLNGPVFHFF